MGDRTSMEVRIYACPPDQVGAVLDLLDEYGCLEQWSSSVGDKLALCTAYGAHEVYGDASEEVISKLGDLDGVVAEAWTSPKYEWLGSLVRHVPGMEDFAAECDDAGTPQFEPDYLRLLLGQHRDKTVGEFLDEVFPRAAGLEHQRVFEVLEHKHGGVLIARPEED